jgi:hypothetical protein
MTNNSEKLIELSNEIKVNSSIVILGAGVSFEAGMPFYRQLAPVIWRVIDENKEIKLQINSDMTIPAKELLGEETSNLIKAFKLIKENQSALKGFKTLFLKINNSHNLKVSKTHENICKLIHEGYIELVISLNWDDLIESSWTRLYGTQINIDKYNLMKPHGDVRNINGDWTFPHELGRISTKELDYINQLAASKPRTLIIIGYSEKDEIIVNKIITPNERRWKVFRISPDAKGLTSIICTAEDALDVISNKLIRKTKGYWEHMDFSKQRDLGPAILGYKLTPSDVGACPRLPQILEAKLKLDVAHSVLIKGAPGCGKSITAYQIAYDFSKEGWEAVRLCASDSNRLRSIELSDTLYKTIYVIDDAQQLKQGIISRMLESSNERSKVVITQTIDFNLPFESITISEIQSVKTLYEEYLKRRNEVLAIVKKYDSSIGDSYMDTPIEWRLKDAANKESPWLFNYTLRGGWKQVKSQFLAAKEVERADILIAMIALKQIISLDKSVNRVWLYGNISRFKKDTKWCDRVLSYLYLSKIIIDTNKIRTLHLESAKRMIANFLLESSQDERKIFNSMIQDEFISHNCPLRGISWFLNSLNTYECSHNLFYSLLTPYIVSKIIERCFKVNLSEDQASAAYVMDFIAGRKYGSLTFKEIIKNYPILYEWIENVDGKTAYAYSNVLNNIYNEDRMLKKRFVSKLNVNKITKQIATITESDMYSWGRFINRLSISQSKKWLSDFYEKLPHDNINTTIQKTSYNNIGGLVELLCGLYSLNCEYAYSKLKECLPVLKKGFEKDLSATWAELDPIFSLYFFGFNCLSKTRPNKIQRKTAKSIVALISEDSLSKCITEGIPRDWERIYYLVYLIDMYDKQKLINAIMNVDLNILDQTTIGLWKIQTRELILLCSILAVDDYEPANEWIYKHRNDIDILCMPLALTSPKTAEYLLATNHQVKLCQNRWWETSAKAVSRLNSYSKKLALSVIKQNQKEISEHLTKLQPIDCECIYLFIKAIKKVGISLANEIFDNIDIENANSNWRKCIANSRGHLPSFLKLLSEIENCSKNKTLLAFIKTIKNLAKT